MPVNNTRRAVRNEDSVSNQLQGWGRKSSLTANLVAELAYRGKKVLMLDLDPQTGLTFSFIFPDEWEMKFSGEVQGGTDKTIKAWLEAYDTSNPISLGSLIHTPQRGHRALAEGSKR